MENLPRYALRSLCALLISGVLTACGGGSSGDGDTGPSPIPSSVSSKASSLSSSTATSEASDSSSSSLFSASSSLAASNSSSSAVTTTSSSSSSRVSSSLSSSSSSEIIVIIPSSSSSSSSSSLSSQSSSRSSSSSLSSSSSSSLSSSSSSKSSSSSSSSVAPLTTRIYFKNTQSYAEPYMHYFNVIPARANSTWPGVAMRNLGDSWFSYEFDSVITSAGIVFSNKGAPQTMDLAFVAPNNCYNNGTWQTAEACGVPVELKANAGLDRKANLGARQALSALASVGDYVSASWTSPAWNGALTGKQVVTPALNSLGKQTVTLTLTTADNKTVSDTMVIDVVAAANGLPERPLLEAPLGFPISGNVSAGKYTFVDAFPNLIEHFPSPVMVTNDGINDLIYVVDKEGAIFVFPNKESVTTAEVHEILNVRSVVLDKHESGLLSMAFDPNYASNGFIYIYYLYGLTDDFVDGKTGDGILERWTVDNPANPTAVIPNSKAELLRVPQLGPDHKGGMIRFHPTDHYLYLGIGDGAYGHSALPQNPPLTGLEARTNNSGQDPTTLRGKFIRIKPEATMVNGKYYSVPADNPFVNTQGYLPEIWSMGHRNPWRWDFDSVAPYTLWETEVGQSGFEEVNVVQKGKDYGWPVCEGTVNRGNLGGNPSRNCATANGNYVPPVDGYDHSAGESIVGGVVYRGNSLPNLTGSFIFGDYVSKSIWSLPVNGGAKTYLGEAPNFVASIGSDLQKNVLLSTYGIEHGGPSSIYKIVDLDAVAVQIPPRLSATGLFADLTTLIPAHGVIEYNINTAAWFDGAKTRHFIAVPNDQAIGFNVDTLWDLPVGTVLVKHMSVVASGNANKPFTTSVLFRQVTGWQAANYRWNAAGTDADLVTEPMIVADGSLENIQRRVQDASGCSGCHKNTDGNMSPLAMHTRQLNGNFTYQPSVVQNQLDMFNRVGLFTSGINNASSYAHFAAPTDNSVSLTERARAYLHTNCSHCHSSNMNLRIDTSLAGMNIINVNDRIIPGNPAASKIYVYQTSNGMRMPNGTVSTNPEAQTLFQAWINELGQDLIQTGVAITATKTTANPNDSITLTLEAVFNNGTQAPISSAVTWSSSNTNVINPAGTTAVINTTALAVGDAIITAQSGNFNAQLQITVKENGITSIEINPEAITLNAPRQLIAYGKNSDGTNASLFGNVSWSMVSGGSVASINADGVVTPLTAGTAIAQASYQGLKKQITITSSPQLILRYKNVNNWSAVNVYLWTVVNGQTNVVKAWPGTAMTEGTDGWWYFGVDKQHLNNGTINVIFNNGSGSKTNDLLNISKSSSYENNTWTDWNGGMPSTGTTFTLSVTNGTITGEGTNNKFAAGRIVTVTADQATIGSSFVGWSSDSIPYILGDATQAAVQILMPEKSLTMTAMFKLSGDPYVNGRAKYEQLCSSCHGENGTGFMQLNKYHENASKTLEFLTNVIDLQMPKSLDGRDLTGLCVGSQPGDCAYDIANMIKNNGWFPTESCTGANCTANKSIDARNLRLLTKEEYLNSVNDIFGANFTTDLMLPVNSDGTVKNFNTASSLILDESRTEGYKKIAGDIATQILSQKAFINLVSGCSTNDCVVTKLGKKIFRRELTAAEVSKYLALYTSTDKGNAVVRALLSSPKFLYRSEMGAPDAATGLFKLNNYEIATLLSYSLWVTTPDDALLTAAASANFNIETEAARMLNDARAEKGLRRFAQGWFIYDRYAYPGVTDLKIQQYFKEETTRFIVENIKNNTPYRNVIKANYTYVNKSLAQYYGFSTVPANDSTWEKVFYPANDPRAETGIFAHGSILASRVSSAKDPSPIKRGLFVRDVLLCQVFKSPPAANFDPVRNADDSNRDSVSRHTSDPSCRGCHQFIDGVGFGLEGLGSNALPRTTETTASGLVKTVIHEGSIKSIFNTPETLLIEDSQEDAYQEVAELADLIAASGQGSACYSRQFFRYMVGRAEDRSSDTDEMILRTYNTGIKNGGGMKDMIVSMMTQPNFVLRR